MLVKQVRVTSTPFLSRFGRAEFWTAFFTGALAGATIFAIGYARVQINEAHEEAQVQHLLASAGTAV